jgi:hypothetical protein
MSTTLEISLCFGRLSLWLCGVTSCVWPSACKERGRDVGKRGISGAPALVCESSFCGACRGERQQRFEPFGRTLLHARHDMRIRVHRKLCCRGRGVPAPDVPIMREPFTADELRAVVGPLLSAKRKAALEPGR